MLTINMSCDNVLVIAFQKFIAKLSANPMSFFRRNFSRLKTLNHMLCQSFCSACAFQKFIFKIKRRTVQTALVCGTQFIVVSLSRIDNIVYNEIERSFNRMDFSSCHISSSILLISLMSSS